MNQGFGHEVPSRHSQQAHQPVSRFLVVIGSGSGQIARLLLASREQVAEFDAGTEEVVVMTQGAVSSTGAAGPEWDRALAGHSEAERAAATVYELAV
jgi:hypothetical protein